MQDIFLKKFMTNLLHFRKRKEHRRFLDMLAMFNPSNLKIYTPIPSEKLPMMSVMAITSRDKILKPEINMFPLRP
jgi:hypothetical protein